MVDITRITKEELARKLDFSLVKRPDLTNDVYKEAMEQVKKYQFGGFYLLPCFVNMVIREIGGFCREHGINIGTGIGFPFGTVTTKTKLLESEEMIELGCSTLDMATNVSALKDGNHKYYVDEIQAFEKLCRTHHVGTRAIIHVGYLTEAEIRTAVRLVAESGIDYVKTETGTGVPGRPNIQDIFIMMETLDKLNSACKVKATGGNIADVYAFIQAGVDLVGTSAGPAIVDALPEMKRRLFGV
jgi:deoxyribose-phosphate aldolase